MKSRRNGTEVEFYCRQNGSRRNGSRQNGTNHRRNGSRRNGSRRNGSDSPLLWQLNSHKHISSIPELLRCCTIIMVTLNLMYVQVFKLRGKSHSLLDDSRMRTTLSNMLLFFVGKM